MSFALRACARSLGFLMGYNNNNTWHVKARTVVLQSSENCRTIDSVVTAQYINVTDTQLRYHSNSDYHQTRQGPLFTYQVLLNFIGWGVSHNECTFPCRLASKLDGRRT